MTTPDDLIKILDRILDASHHESDITALRQSLQADARFASTAREKYPECK
ncbi:MAG: hypothetical protein AAF757_03190 [Cyanobacteria bacterium P01_D01_bin.116]